jgi:hypothetical protein
VPANENPYCINMKMLLNCYGCCEQSETGIYHKKKHYLGAIRKVWRYQRGNQNLYIEEEQTT